MSEAEGGTVRRDLFSSPEELSAVFLDSQTQLLTLATQKLRAAAAAVQAEGWAWVDHRLDADPSAWRGFGWERAGQREPAPEEAAEIEWLAAEQCRCAEDCDRHQEEGDPDEEDFDLVERQLGEAWDAAQRRPESARARLQQWEPAQLARAGARVRLDSRGQLVVERGLVHPADCRTLPDAPDAPDAPGPGSRWASRGRRAAGRPELSEPLMRDLTAHRTAALQVALLGNPHVALAALVHRMAETVFELYGGGNDVVKVSVRVTGDGALAQDAGGYAASRAAAVLGAAETEWGDRLPGNPAALFQWLLAQPQETLLELLAYCTARSFNAVTSRARERDHSDALAEALGLEMADRWQPTAQGYFSRVSKARALEAVKEATGNDATRVAAGMKKGEVTAYCAQLLQDVRWVPAPLRVMAADSAPAPEDESGAAGD